MIRIGCFDIGQGSYRRLYERASPQRQQRADRYLRQEDKLRCVAADALLRWAVKQTLSLETFTVAADPMGKPFLEGVEGFHFNLSHSGRWVVIGYGTSPVGIDVQQILPDGAREGIARRFFTADEQDWLSHADGQRRTERFYQIWTAKESYLKYLGTGLRQSLDSFSVLPGLAPQGVNFHTIPLEGYSLTLCAAEAPQTVEWPTLSQLLDIN